MHLSPIHTAEQLKTPTLMVHAERDARVPLRDFEKFVERAEESGAPLQSRTIGRRMTGMQDPAVREQYLDLILRFFRRNSSSK